MTTEYTPEELAEQAKYEAEAKAKYLDVARKNETLMIAAIREFHPYYADPDFDEAFPITAERAEAACAVVRNEIKQSAHIDPVIQYREYNADVIQSIANSVWFGMPESSSVRNHSAFDVVCELAEGY